MVTLPTSSPDLFTKLVDEARAIRRATWPERYGADPTKVDRVVTDPRYVRCPRCADVAPYGFSDPACDLCDGGWLDNYPDRAPGHTRPRVAA